MVHIHFKSINSVHFFFFGFFSGTAENQMILHHEKRVGY